MWLYALLILPARTFLMTLVYLLASGEFSPKNVGCCCVLCCIIITIIIIMDICKAPTLWLRALNKHGITHIMYTEMEMLPAIKIYFFKKLTVLTHNVDKGSSITMQKMPPPPPPPTHTHTHTVQTDRDDGQCCLSEIFWEEKCLEFAFEWWESNRVPGRLGRDCSRCGGQSVKKCESQGLCCWSTGVWACVCLTKSGESGKDCKGIVQKDKREQNRWLRCNTCQQFCILFVQKFGASGVAVGVVCSFGGVVLWEWGVQQYFGLSASVELLTGLGVPMRRELQ